MVPASCNLPAEPALLQGEVSFVPEGAHMASTSPVPVTHKQIREARRRRVKRLRDAWPFDNNTNGGLEMPTPLKDVEPHSK